MALRRAGTARSIHTVAGWRLEEANDALNRRTLALPDLLTPGVVDGRAAATVGGGVHVRWLCGQAACLCGESAVQLAGPASSVSVPAWSLTSLR